MRVPASMGVLAKMPAPPFRSVHTHTDCCCDCASSGVSVQDHSSETADAGGGQAAAEASEDFEVGCDAT